jgi:hypothetical protein
VLTTTCVLDALRRTSSGRPFMVSTRAIISRSVSSTSLGGGLFLLFTEATLTSSSLLLSSVGMGTFTQPGALLLLGVCSVSGRRPTPTLPRMRRSRGGVQHQPI